MARAPRPVARFALLAFLATAGLAARGEAADDAPKIRTLTPTAAARGTSVEITIEGTNLFPFEEVKCSVPGVVVQILEGSTPVKVRVRLTIPETAAPGTVQIAVKTKNGTVTSERFSIRLRAPLVSKVKPDAVKRGGEYELTITGSYFSLPGIDPKVTVEAPMTVAKMPKSDDKTLLVKVTVPSATPTGTHAVAIEMPDGKANAAFTVLLSPPTAAAVKPASVPRGGESDVKVEGLDLGGITAVALAVPDTAVSMRLSGAPEAKSVPIHLTVAPDAKPGPRTLVLSCPDGVATAVLTIALRPPALTGVLPVGGARGTTTELKIASTDVPADAVLRLVPPDPLVRIELGKSGGWRVTSEANAKPGPRTIALSTGDGAAILPFHVTLRAPSVAAIFPAEVEAGKSVDLRVEGENLQTCTWSLVPADPDVSVAPGKTPFRLSLTVKPGAKPGPRCLVARNDDGASVGITSVKGSSASVPVVSSATPPRIYRPGKATVTLAGMNLRGAGDKAPEVSIAGPGGATLSAEIAQSMPSSLALTVTTDASTAPGTYIVAVKTEDGGAAIPLIVGPTVPTIASATPARAVRPTTATLVLTGAGLSNPDGSAPAIVVAHADGSAPLAVQKVVATNEKVTFDLVLGPEVELGGYVVNVATTDGGAAAPFAVDGSPPSLKTIVPARVGVPATQDFVLTGENLVNPDGKPAALQVTRVGSAADTTPTVVAFDATSITFRLTTRPGTPPGPHLVSIRTVDGTASSLFNVVEAAPPIVTGMDATSANRLGTILTIVRGTGLAGATAIVFAGKGVTGTILQNTNDRECQIKVVVAADAEPGPRTFTLTAPGGATSSGSVVLTVK